MAYDDLSGLRDKRLTNPRYLFNPFYYFERIGYGADDRIFITQFHYTHYHNPTE